MKCRAPALLFALCALFAAPAHSHAISTAQLALDLRADGTIVAELDLSLRDLELGLGLDANRDARITWAELLAQRTSIQAMVDEGLRISANDRACTLEPGVLRVRRYADASYASLRIVGRCASEPGRVAVSYALMFAQDPTHRALVQLQLGAVSRVGIAQDSARSLQFDLARPDTGTAAFFAEGVHHILIGYDHLAFLLSLLLPVALSYRAGWSPQPGSGSALRRAAALVTAFTAAHSITLSLSVLGWVVPAPRPVEAAIAASVVLAALNNVWPVVTRRPWLLAGGFGLVHGFGFAGALGELGLPEGSRAMALLGFNLGVEAGQLAIVLAVLPLLYFASRWRAYPRAVMAPASIAVALLGAWWLVQRLA